MAATTEDNYQLLLKQAQALVEGETDWIANTANISALLFNSLNNVNFAGVYRYENQELILGPFQGYSNWQRSMRNSRKRKANSNCKKCTSVCWTYCLR